MNNIRKILAAFLLLTSIGFSTNAQTESKFQSPEKTPFLWIEPTSVSRPWSYWWWMGSAVDETNLTRELERLSRAGWGGVHIIPIYGAKGWENKYIEYLSPQWLKMLNFTIEKANELGLQVDMTLGTGWCFGGPFVTDEEANARLIIRTNLVKAGESFKSKFDARQKIQRVIAFEKSGGKKDLTAEVKQDGTIEWTPQQGEWTVYMVSQQPSGQKVKRSAPGGAGHMLNLIYPPALSNYLNWFDRAFSNHTVRMPRAVYHDSYEYRSEWAPDFFERFFKLRGYRLQDYLPYLLRHKNDEITGRIISDYRETVSDIIIEQSMPIWIEWSHKRGLITRNEAHGSPANLLDLYALADIPETEMFYRDRNTLISKLASSAGHISGKKLIAAETGTWLKEHFHESLADIKELVDQMFLAGVNHIMFHGTCYSPDEAPWPGWVFYASTQLNPRNSIWRDVPTLSQYIARCQAILQYGEPANDVLLYYPFYDVWQKLDGLLPHFTIHGLNWFENFSVSKVAAQLWSKGYSFDYISDRQLKMAKVIDGNTILTEGKTRHKCLIIPLCEYLPDSTLNEIIRLAENGATVIFEHLPSDVPGFYNLQKRRENFKKLLSRIKLRPVKPEIKLANIGKGKVYVCNVFSALTTEQVMPHFYIESNKSDNISGESVNLEYVAREFDGGYHVFVVNRSNAPVKGWFNIGWKIKSAVLMNPMTGETGIVPVATDARNLTLVYLDLNPSESAILRLFKNTNVVGNNYKFWVYDENSAQPINGEWRVEFIEGGPVLPPPLTITNLDSWTRFNGDDYKRFAGAARYTIKFNLRDKNENDFYILDLGKVCQSARVKLNGEYLGALITSPFRIVCKGLKPENNILEIEVTNLSANRIRDLDRRKVQWKVFNDINIVNINYKPFDASNWELVDSGLIGPVKLFKARQKP